MQNFRVLSAEGARCGLVKDVYFDDQTWAIRYLIVALDLRRFGNRQVLLIPEQFSADFDSGSIHLRFPESQIIHLPLAASMRPVCQQYASFSLGLKAVATDPYLRSGRAVLDYKILAGDDFAGTLADFIFDDESWMIRYLSIEQVIERKRIRFHILPQSVERFTWATQRMRLRDLNPVELASVQTSRLNTLAA